MKLVQIYLTLNKVAVLSNFLAFFAVLVDKFTLLDPDPHIEWGSGSRSENECESMRIRIHSPELTIMHVNLTNLRWCEKLGGVLIRAVRQIVHHRPLPGTGTCWGLGVINIIIHKYNIRCCRESEVGQLLLLLVIEGGRWQRPVAGRLWRREYFTLLVTAGRRWQRLTTGRLCRRQWFTLLVAAGWRWQRLMARRMQG